MNNTPNQSNPRPTEPTVKRPVRAVRRPGEPSAVPHQAVQQVTPPASARPAVRRPNGMPPTAQSVQPAAAQNLSQQPTPMPQSAPQRPAQPTAVRRPAAQQSPPAKPAQPMQAVPPKPARLPAKPERTTASAQPKPSRPQKKPTMQTAGPRQTADAPTTQVDLARRTAEADNSATRRMAVTPPAGQKSVDAPSGSGRSGGTDEKPQKKKKQMSEGVATLLSVVKAITYIVFVIVIAGFLSYYTIRIANDMFAFVKSDEQVTVTIPENATIYDVSEVLAEGGIIVYPDIFELYAKLNEDDGKFVAGDYEINGMMNYDELLMAFKEKTVRGRIWLTIPEGYTIDEMIDLFLENGMGGTREDWVAAVNNLDLYAEDFPFVKALIGNLSENRTYALEGYLFPDTYEFYTDAKASQIVYKLLNRFNNVFKDAFYTRADELGYTVDEIITLASMIEKETRLYNEFEQVSSVFHNRLRNPATYPYLESDATIMYAIQYDTGTRKEDMTHDDLSYVSPYNTYTNKGLPPGPIANPSYQAITCALYPEETNYYYFVSRKNGETIFSTTLAQHNAAVAEVSREG